MKLHHYSILFAAISLVIVLLLDIQTSTTKAVLEEQNQVEHNLSTAVDEGVHALAQSYTKRELIGSRQHAVERFFRTLYANFELLSDPIAQQTMRQYIPLIITTEQNGIYAYFHDLQIEEGIEVVRMQWSERYPYVYEDKDFIYTFTWGDTVKLYDVHHIITKEDESPYIELDYHEFSTSDRYASFRTKYPNHFLLEEQSFYLVRQDAMIKTIEKIMEYYLNEYNHIAKQYGITYEVSLPTLDVSELTRSIEQPSMIVIFQGYPLKNTNRMFHRIAIAGARIQLEELYGIEEKGWYKLYHRWTCDAWIPMEHSVNGRTYDSILDCVKEGAYACEICCVEGVRVPEYTLP